MTVSSMEHHKPIEIDTYPELYVAAFSANGEYLLTGHKDGIRVWWVEGKVMTRKLDTDYVTRLAVSNDGSWIAAVTSQLGIVVVWDANTYKQKHDSELARCQWALDLDFSPDSAWMVVVASSDDTVTIFDNTTGRRARTLRQDEVRTAKYSPEGDRIATASETDVRVWDSMDGRLLYETSTGAPSDPRRCLVWFDNFPWLASGNKIKKIQTITVSDSEWLVSDGDSVSSVALPTPEEFVACATKRTVTFWDVSSHAQFAPIQHSQDIQTITFSPAGQSIAIAEISGKITIKRLSRTSVSIIDWHINDTVLDCWRRDELKDVDNLLTKAIPNSGSSTYHVLASRALVRTHLGEHNAAIVDAKESITLEPSVFGYITQSLALVYNGESHKAYRACDMAFQFCDLAHARFLLLLKAVIVFIAGEHDDAISRVDDLMNTVHSGSIFLVVKAYMHYLRGMTCMDKGDYNGAIRDFQSAQAHVRPYTGLELSELSLLSGWKFDDLGSTIQRQLCEALYKNDQRQQAGEAVLKIANTSCDDMYTSHELGNWVFNFMQRCITISAFERDTTMMGWAAEFRMRCATKLAALGDGAAHKQQYEDAIRQYSNALSLNPWMPQILIERSKLYLKGESVDAASHDAIQAISLPSSPWNSGQVLKEWATVDLRNGLWKKALTAARELQVSGSMMRRMFCDALESMDGVMDAVECFHWIAGGWTAEALSQDEFEWVRDFGYRCSKKLEDCGDAAMDKEQHSNASEFYSAALSIHPKNTQGLFILQSKKYMAEGSWEDALEEVNKATELDPSCLRCDEAKRAALHGAGRYEDAIRAHETMLIRMSLSSDSQIRERRGRCCVPSEIRQTIREIVQETIRHLPLVLIDIDTGRLYDKRKQEDAFMSQPNVNALVSSMVTRVDRRRIKLEVKKFFKYVMFSHKWEDGEPLFKEVSETTVKRLGDSRTQQKLKMFCQRVKEAGYRWAWSDTCCINKEDNSVLQEALVSMFRWYRRAAMVFVFLRGVRAPGRLGELAKNIWNTRAWTLQEYIAAKVIRFYTEDWTPYRNLVTSNHKESPEIISEMETATGVPAKQLAALCPGLTSIREKLRLASKREVMREEDAAYSLLGIFSVSGLPAIYGEREKALGRLLAHIIPVSGDISILAWTGQSGGFNSCLPGRITAFDRLATSHLPRPMEDGKMNDTIGKLRQSTPDFDLVKKLYDRLSELPAPWFAATRMKLPCIAFKLPPVSAYRTRSGRVFRAETPTFGTVDIDTKQDLSQSTSLYLVHPWIDVLLDREESHVGTFVEDEGAEDSELDIDDEDRSNQDMTVDPPTFQSEHYVVPMDEETRALRLVARLRQPFGALLLASRSGSEGRPAVVPVCKRVAADCEITVQLREDVPLGDILNNVRMLDVL